MFTLTNWDRNNLAKEAGLLSVCLPFPTSLIALRDSYVTRGATVVNIAGECPPSQIHKKPNSNSHPVTPHLPWELLHGKKRMEVAVVPHQVTWDQMLVLCHGNLVGGVSELSLEGRRGRSWTKKGKRVPAQCMPRHQIARLRCTQTSGQNWGGRS